MKLVKVVGSITSTIKDETLKGFKLMLVKTVTEDLEEKEDYYVAVDTVGVGEGEIALISTGRTANYAASTRHKNVDSAIVAKVERVDLEGRNIKS